MNVTKEQIKEWKAKYGDLFEVTVEGKTCILRKPNRKDLSYASVVKDPIKMSETLLNRLWLGGDEEIKTDDELFMATVNVMEDVLKVKEAEIKKL
ncbi:MAG: hypothetical protein IJB60_08255 [Bacteroidaceae bacterium]|nr:hypothetical protein [Bacteroidaceae bacterium]